MHPPLPPRYIEPVQLNADGTPSNDPGAATRAELRDLVESLADTQVRQGQRETA